MLDKGAGSLTDAELLALFLRTGGRGQDVLELAHHILREAGSLSDLARMTAHGVILVDNTLWGGAVVDGRGDETDRNLAGVRAFNDHVAADQRVQVVMLPIGDGVTMIQLR